MPNCTKTLKNVSQVFPILRAVAAENNKTEIFVTDLFKFAGGVLCMTLINYLIHNQDNSMMNDNMSMEMSTNDTDMGMNSFSAKMFFSMWAQMRGGAMTGNILANLLLRFCSQTSHENVNSNWRDCELSKNVLSALPLAGAFFKTNQASAIVHEIVMDSAMYFIGTLAMMYSLYTFDEAIVEEAATVIRMYLGMTIGMIGAMALISFLEKFYDACCSYAENSEPHLGYSSIP